MWQKLMRTWLIGAAVTMATPEGALRAETNNPSDKIAGSSERSAETHLAAADTRKIARTYNDEPALSELLADPICHALMKCDGVTPDSLATLIDSWQTRRHDRRDSEEG